MLIVVPCAQVLGAAVPVLEELPPAPMPLQEKLAYPSWIIGPPELGSPEMINATAGPIGSWELDKRQTIVSKKLPPYSCVQGRDFVKALCNANSIMTYCKEPRAPLRFASIDGEQACPINSYCINEYLGANPQKAACVSLARLYQGFLDSGKDAACLNLKRYGAFISPNEKVSTAIRTPNGNNPYKGYSPFQITLTDGPGTVIQAVGSADSKSGEFISKAFRYIGAITECVQTVFNAPSVYFFSALISV